MTTKETLLKNHALSEWLTSYDFDKPEEVFDAIVQCQNEEEWEVVIEKYQIDIWEHIQDCYWSWIIEKIQRSYETAKILHDQLSSGQIVAK